ncbi:NUDIX hydrolase [Arthrobacter sp. 7Tela_A1]|uniref:NUDIX hydrolase n=1 Tax=Arthrobacter sp. 7Tela_A1 TaxID=3093745 RepID=UPI003BB7D066
MTAPSPWRDVWVSPGERLRVQARDEEDWTRHRFLSNSEGDGAVAVVLDGTQVLFIDAERPVIGRTLRELPRGQADAADSSPTVTAERELLEETGLTALDSTLLGQIWAESGLCADAVNVVLIRVDRRREQSPAEYSAMHWIERERLSQEIASGRIRDGITISALALVWAQGAFGPSTASG